MSSRRERLGAGPRRVGDGDLALDGGRDKDVAVSLKRAGAVGHEASGGEAFDAACSAEVFGYQIRRESGIAEDGAVALDDADEAHAFVLDEVARGVEAHVPEPLEDDALAFEAAVEAAADDVLGIAEELADHVVDAAAGGLAPAGDPALGRRLARDAGERVDVGGVEGPVLVGHPGHFAFAGAHVGRRHVAARTDVAVVCEFLREASGNEFELVFVIVIGADREAALGAAERHVDERAFEGHERGERLHLLLVDDGRVADAALDGQPVLAVHRAPAAERPVTAAQSHGEAQLDDGLAFADGLHKVRGHTEGARRAVEHAAHAAQEVGLGRRAHADSSGKGRVVKAGERTTQVCREQAPVLSNAK